MLCEMRTSTLHNYKNNYMDSFPKEKKGMEILTTHA